MNDEVPVNEPRNNIPPAEPTSGAVAEPIVPAGAQLAALREARGWTTAQIASQLNLANRQIQALEADNYAALPGMVIVRGFIRAYAKVLQVDPAPILAAIIDGTATPAVLLPERNTLSASFSETSLSYSGPRGFAFKVMIGVAVLAIIGVALFAGQHLGWIPVSNASKSSKVEEKLAPVESAEALVEAPVAQPEVIETIVTPNSNESSVPVESKPAITTPPPAPAPVVEVKPALVLPAPAVAPESVAVTPPVPVVAPVNKVPTPVVTVPANSKDALAIQVRQDSWVEIKRADNSVLVSRLLKAGTSEVVVVTEPVSMVIGNAAGVDVTLRGKPVDVVAGNTSNVARLNLK